MLTLDYQTKSRGQRSFSYQAPVIWNQLLVSVRRSTSQFFQIFLENLSLLKNLFFSPIALMYDSVDVCVCVCVRARVGACVFMLKFECTEFWKCAFKECVRA